MTDELRRKIEEFIMEYENNKKQRYDNISNANSWDILKRQENLLENAISLLADTVKNDNDMGYIM